MVGSSVWRDVQRYNLQDYAFHIEEQVYLSIALLMIPLEVGFSCLGCNLFCGFKSVDIINIRASTGSYLGLWFLQFLLIIIAWIYVELTVLEVFVILMLLAIEGSAFVYIDWEMVQRSCQFKYSIAAKVKKPVEIPLENINYRSQSF